MRHGLAFGVLAATVLIGCTSNNKANSNNNANNSQIRDLQATIAALQKTATSALVQAVVPTTAPTVTPSASSSPTPSPAASPAPKPSPSPSPSPSPTPAAAAKKIGTPAQFGTSDGATKLEVTLNSIKDPSPSTNQFNQPKGRFVLADWTITNTGTKEFSVNPLYLKIQTADGFLVSEANHAGQPEPSIALAVLAPSQTVRGYLSFDVAAGAVLKSAIFQPSGSPQLVVADLTAGQ